MRYFLKNRGRAPLRHFLDVSDRRRLAFLIFLAIFLATAVILRLIRLQISQRDFYEAVATGQHKIFAKLLPERGEILVREKGSDALFPVAANQEKRLIYAEPKNIANPSSAAYHLAEILELDEMEVKAKLTKPDDPYEPLKSQVDEATVKTIKELQLTGVGFIKENFRLYPEKDFGGHILGFVGQDTKGRSGRYGVEGYFDEELRGEQGYLESERDAVGRIIAIGKRQIQDAEDGADLVLTINRDIQYFVCGKIKAAVKRHGALGGSVVVMEPENGAIMAMCSYPDYDPNEYSKVEDIRVFNNPIIFAQYEPGSVFKAVTMAAAIDLDKVSPESTYVDEGQIQINDRIIRNSDGKTYEKQTMTQILEKSLNTGAVYAVKTIGAESFREYVEDFGFGGLTGIELSTENRGDVSSLRKRGEIWSATASFGQGISVTPIQLVAAYAAIANGGKLIKPYIVDEIRLHDGTVIKTGPKMVRRVISARTSTLLKGMLVSVVENGHGGRAGVSGYYVAGKTGTAQVPKKEGLGYEPDITIGSFVGFAPADIPAFVMLVKIDNPRDVIWAESSAAPVFGEIAQFILNYLEIPPER